MIHITKSIIRNHLAFSIKEAICLMKSGHSSFPRNITTHLPSGIFLPLEYMFVFCLYAPICLYGNIPDLRFIASDGEICLCLSHKGMVK